MGIRRTVKKKQLVRVFFSSRPHALFRFHGLFDCIARSNPQLDRFSGLIETRTLVRGQELTARRSCLHNQAATDTKPCTETTLQFFARMWERTWWEFGKCLIWVEKHTLSDLRVAKIVSYDWHSMLLSIMIWTLLDTAESTVATSKSRTFYKPCDAIKRSTMSH